MFVSITFICPFLAFGNWVTQDSGTNLELNSVFFIDSLYGWAVGGGGNSGIILRTTNGGQNWLTAYTDTQSIFEAAWFISRQTGWVAGGRDNYVVMDSTCQKILKTTDGGITWQRQWNRNSSSNWRCLYGVCFVGNNGWATVEGWNDNPESTGCIIHTTDGGTTWTTQSLVGAYCLCPWDIHFPSISRGVCSGGINLYPYDNTDGHIWYTSNGGTSWSSGHNWVPGTAAMGFFTNVWMVDTLKGWCVGSAFGMSVREPGRVARTTNGGQSWSLCNPSPLRPFWGVYFADSSWGWIGTTAGGILLTTNSGRNWQDDNSGVTNRISDIHGINRNNAWAVGTNGTIIKYVPSSGIEYENQISLNALAKPKISIVPNPFSSRTEIRFDPSVRVHVTELAIYDASGRSVKPFNHLTCKPLNRISWDGKDETGNSLPGGIYFLEVKVGGTKIREKLILVR